MIRIGRTFVDLPGGFTSIMSAGDAAIWVWDNSDDQGFGV
jgi:hypothetical protein